MKFHRPLLVAGLASVGSVLFVAHAQNNEAQNKALEALRKVQSGQASTPAPTPSAVRTSDNSAQQKALQALREQQAGGRATAPVAAPAVVSRPSVPADPSNNAAQQKALEALRGGPVATPTPPSSPAVVTATPAQLKAMEALHKHQTANPVAIPAEPSPKQIQAQQALSDKWNAAAGVTSTAAPVIAAEPEKPKGPMTKMERLAELTRRYKADELTPQEYHTQRAKIVAEP